MRRDWQKHERRSGEFDHVSKIIVPDVAISLGWIRKKGILDSWKANEKRKIHCLRFSMRQRTLLWKEKYVIFIMAQI